MEPRILRRTHYQADEPAFIELIVNECVDATRSSYKENIAKKLVEALPAGQKLNAAAASYAVDMTRGLGLLGDNNALSPLGLFLHLTTYDHRYDDRFLTFPLERKLAFLRVLLEGDAVAVLYLLRHAQDHGEIAAGGEGANALATELFLYTYAQYLELSSGISERVALKNELNKLRKNPYRGNTGRHKLLFHVRCLQRLGFLRSVNNSLTFSLTTSGMAAAANLSSSFPTIATLERRATAGELMEATALVVLSKPKGPVLSATDFETRVMAEYERVVDLGFVTAPINLLLDLVEYQTALDGGAVTRESSFANLNALQKRHSKNIRFHVDRRGRPAYILIDNSLRRTA